MEMNQRGSVEDVTYESFKTTGESYPERDALAGAQQKREQAVLTGDCGAS